MRTKLRDEVAYEVNQRMAERFSADELPRACLYYADETLRVLARRDVYAVLQAGSMNWPCRAENWADDGVSPTHFTYEFSMSEAWTRLQRGLTPEIHVWVGLPCGQVLIDLTTKHIPTQSERILGFPWEAPLPPEYLWTPTTRLPQGVRYVPNQDATAFAYHNLKSCKTRK